MDNYGIKPEWRDAWQQLDKSHWEPDDWEGYRYCTDLAVHLLAGWMKSEFNREHVHCMAKQIVMFNPDRVFIEWYNGDESCHDPHHGYTADDWERAAHEALNGR